MNLKQKITSLLCALAVLLLGGCGESPTIAEEHPEVTDSGLVLHVGQSSQARTAMGDEDGTSQEIRWVVGDKLTVWAQSTSTSEYVLNATSFTFATYNAEFHSADFLADVSAMAEGTYTYHAVYPEPAARTGTQVSYTLPATQSGRYDPALDVMTATTTGNALLPRSGNQHLIPWEEPQLNFSHLFHLIRIRIPAGKNYLGLPLRRLEITFPQEVVGTVTFDALNPTATATWSNLSNKITVDIPQSVTVDAGEGYVWLHVKPTALDGTITFCGYDDAGVKSYDITTTIQKDLEAQRITPIALTIPGPHIPVVYLDLREAGNNLGEAWQKITLSGLSFGDGTPNGTTNSVTINATDEDYIVAVYPTLNSDGTANMASVQGVSVNTTFESEHALLTNKTITLPSSLQPTTEYTSPVNDTPFTVPYLLYEDFSAQSNYTDEATTGSKTLDIAGWTASRTNCESGVIRLAVFWVFGGRYQGRLDSTPLSMIKAGKSPTISVTFNAYNNISNKVAVPLQMGWTTTTGAIEAGTDIEHLITTQTIAKNGTAAPTFTISGATSATRLSWRTNVTSGSWWTYNYLGIDNVKVQIAN